MYEFYILSLKTKINRKVNQKLKMKNKQGTMNLFLSARIIKHSFSFFCSV